ncbi:hypothetical protein ACIQ8D_30515 [Streptomyces sp. NPDC096094]|uniref:hypothetical protein n=1 Tax=Streptomyces sp. NPDC096094 TaxID=3366073 RepID=UPI0037F3F98F
MSDVRAGAAGESLAHLRHSRCTGARALGNGIGYRLPVQAGPEGGLAQQYPPGDLVEKDDYRPTRYGGECDLHERLTRLRRPPGRRSVAPAERGSRAHRSVGLTGVRPTLARAARQAGDRPPAARAG